MVRLDEARCSRQLCQGGWGRVGGLGYAGEVLERSGQLAEVREAVSFYATVACWLHSGIGSMAHGATQAHPSTWLSAVADVRSYDPASVQVQWHLFATVISAEVTQELVVDDNGQAFRTAGCGAPACAAGDNVGEPTD